MTSRLHDDRRRWFAVSTEVRSGPEPSAPVKQRHRLAGRQWVASAPRRSRRLHLTVGHCGLVARMRVSGELTEIGRRHLAALLEMMVTAGCERVVVHLAGVDMVDSGLLQVLRAARTRLEGRLTVTADRAEARSRLTLPVAASWDLNQTETKIRRYESCLSFGSAWPATDEPGSEVNCDATVRV